MYNYKYGEFADMQISEAKAYIRKRIFFLLFVAEDLETRELYPNVNLPDAHEDIMGLVSGFNDLLMQPPELVIALSRLEEAKKNLIEDKFDFRKYRKLILDAGAEIIKIAEPTDKEVTADA